MQTEPIYLLAKQNKITEGEGIWKGIRNENDQITLQSFMKKFDLSDDKNNTLIIKPTFSDLDSAVIWMVNRDLRRRLPSLTENVKDWINVLYTVMK